MSAAVLRVLYFAFVYLYLLYGVEIYANTSNNHLHKLVVLNNKILGIARNIIIIIVVVVVVVIILMPSGV